MYRTRSGLGATCNPADSIPGDGTWSLMAALNPMCMFQPALTAAGEGVADVYQKVEYGTIPAPTAIVGLTPEETTANLAAFQQQINDAVAAGTYNPSGNLPVNASGDINVPVAFAWGGTTLLVIGAGLLFALMVLKR